MAEHSASGHDEFNVVTRAAMYGWPAAVPDIKVETDTGYRLVDIVQERYDIGLRMVEAIAKDMVSARLTPDFRRVIVGAPADLAQHPEPASPQNLLQRNCITLRLATRRGLFGWPLEHQGKTERVQVRSQLT